jgi:hypothetical protein
MGALAAAFALHTAAAVLLCGITLHPQHKDLSEKMQAGAESVAPRANARVETIQVSSFDGVKLSAWFFRTQNGIGCVNQ